MTPENPSWDGKKKHGNYQPDFEWCVWLSVLKQIGIVHGVVVLQIVFQAFRSKWFNIGADWEI
jgi:hypothetical protein